MIIYFNHLNHTNINVKHMAFQKGLNLHIEVKGLSSGHYNTHHFKLTPCL
jgi:hypothetical protein